MLLYCQLIDLRDLPIGRDRGRRREAIELHDQGIQELRRHIPHPEVLPELSALLERSLHHCRCFYCVHYCTFDRYRSMLTMNPAWSPDSLFFGRLSARWLCASSVGSTPTPIIRSACPGTPVRLSSKSSRSSHTLWRPCSPALAWPIETATQLYLALICRMSQATSSRRWAFVPPREPGACRLRSWSTTSIAGLNSSTYSSISAAEPGYRCAVLRLSPPFRRTRALASSLNFSTSARVIPARFHRIRSRMVLTPSSLPMYSTLCPSRRAPHTMLIVMRVLPDSGRPKTTMWVPGNAPSVFSCSFSGQSRRRLPALTASDSSSQSAPQSTVERFVSDVAFMRSACSITSRLIESRSHSPSMAAASSRHLTVRFSSSTSHATLSGEGHVSR